MSNLSVNYLGIPMRNPVLAGASTITIQPDKARALADAGVGGIVLESMFEEEIRAETADTYEALQNDMHAEAYDYLRADMPLQVGTRGYLARLEEIRKSVAVPVIASINCVTTGGWPTFARQLEAAGAAALEVNVYDIPLDPACSGADIEARHLEIAAKVVSAVRIPVAIKISPFYSATLHFVQSLERAGAKGVVLFNRFMQPDIDVQNLRLRTCASLAKPEDLRLPLRWIALLRAQVGCSLCLTSGVLDSGSVIKSILAGADAVQVCSALYRQKDYRFLATWLDEIDRWMSTRGYTSLDAFRGLMAEKDPAHNRGFERAQYVKTLKPGVSADIGAA